MTDKPVILFPVGFRSDAVLTEPIRKEMKKQGKVTLIEVALQPGCFGTSYLETEKMIRTADPDFALVNADRVEMAGAAAALFHHGIPFGHIYAGVGNNIGTSDDINRHVMTLWSTLQCCQNKAAANRARAIRKEAGLKTNYVFDVGITHMDDVKLERCPTPDAPFDLILYNAPMTQLKPVYQEVYIKEDLLQIDACVGPGIRHVVIIHPNPDKGNDLIVNYISRKRAAGWFVEESLPRNQFLYLLSKCDNFITNSSAGYYEAPVFLQSEKIHHIGTRNRNRDPGPFVTGATERIIKITERYLCSLMNG